MSDYPFEKREQLLNEIARQADTDIFYGMNKENNPLKRRTKANRLLNDLKPRKLEWLAKNKNHLSVIQDPAMQNLNWKDISGNGKYGLD